MFAPLNLPRNPLNLLQEEKSSKAQAIKSSGNFLKRCCRRDIRSVEWQDE